MLKLPLPNCLLLPLSFQYVRTITRRVTTALTTSEENPCAGEEVAVPRAAQVPSKHAAAAGQGSFGCLAEVESQKGKKGAENTLITTKNSHISKSTEGDKLQIDSSSCNLVVF